LGNSLSSLSTIVRNKDKLFLPGDPPELKQQLAEHVWHKYVRARLGDDLSPDELDEAKNQFVGKFLGQPTAPLSSGFGVPPEKPSGLQRAVSGTVLGPALGGITKGTQSILELAHKFDPSQVLYPEGRNEPAEALGEIAKQYDKLTSKYRAENPIRAGLAEFAGRTVPSLPAVEAVGAAIPLGEVPAGASALARLGAKLPHYAATGATASLGFTSSPGEFATAALVNMGLGPILGRLLGGRTITASPEAQAIAKVTETEDEQLLRTVFKERFPNVPQDGPIDVVTKRVADAAPPGKAMEAFNEFKARKAASQAGTKVQERLDKFTEKYGKPTPEQEATLRTGTSTQRGKVYKAAGLATKSQERLDRIKAAEASRTVARQTAIARKLMGRPVLDSEVDRIAKGETGTEIAARPDAPQGTAVKGPKQAKVSAPTTPPPPTEPSPEALAGMHQEQPQVAGAVAAAKELGEAVKPKLSEEIPPVGKGLAVRLSEAERAKPDAADIAIGRLRSDFRDALAKLGFTEANVAEAQQSKRVSVLLRELQRQEEAVRSGNLSGAIAKGRPPAGAPAQQASRATKAAERAAKNRAKAAAAATPAETGYVEGGQAVRTTTGVPERQEAFVASFGREPTPAEAILLGDPEIPLSEVVDHDIQAEFDAKKPSTETFAKETLPRNLAGAKPRYGYGSKQFTLTFENDLDRAAYILAQSVKSKHDSEYLDWVMKSTGMSENAARAHGRSVRARIKEMAKSAPEGDLFISGE